MKKSSIVMFCVFIVTVLGFVFMPKKDAKIFSEISIKVDSGTHFNWVSFKGKDYLQAQVSCFEGPYPFKIIDSLSHKKVFILYGDAEKNASLVELWKNLELKKIDRFHTHNFVWVYDDHIEVSLKN